jgi:hypothetical protein
VLFKVKDFKFEIHSDGGDSGQLYLAMRGTDGKKFIVKHEYADCVCNEFVYFAIAKELGLKVLECNLFETNNSGIFKYGRAIAIEYIEKQKIGKIVGNKSKVKNWQEFFYHWALYTAFLEADGMEMIVDKNGYCYRIDTTDALALSDTFALGISHPVAFEHLCKHMPENERMIFDELTFKSREIKEKYSQEEYGLFRGAIEKLAHFDLEKLNPYLNELCKVYAKEIKAYYIKFLTSCKNACNRFLDA